MLLLNNFSKLDRNEGMLCGDFELCKLPDAETRYSLMAEQVKRFRRCDSVTVH